MKPKEPKRRRAIVLAAGEGRKYEMGRMSAVFKADNAETARTYSVSEWWLDPKTKGPGAHAHPYDHVYYVLSGTLSVFVDEEWTHCRSGAFVMIPGGTPHDFENRGEERAGMLSFNNAAGFESEMPSIVEWFAKHPQETIP
jgi:mannose-6-phosphate isomerase-like protein (cupin superfamily)